MRTATLSFLGKLARLGGRLFAEGPKSSSPRANRLYRTAQGESGQILLLTVLCMGIVIGMTGLVIDVGIAYRNVGDAQNDVDAAVLAAAQELQPDGDTAAAQNAAEQWAAQNDVDPADLNCCVFEDLRPTGDPDGIMDTVSGSVRGTSPTFFMPLFGIDSLPVERSAAAQVVHARGGTVCPWGLVGDANGGGYYGVEPGRVYVLKIDQNGVENGNFRGLDLGITGVNGYRDYIRSGCNGDDASIWMEGDQVVTRTLPGNLGQATRNALGDYYAYELTDGVEDPLRWDWCDVVFDRDPTALANGTSVITGYNPFLDGPRDGCSHDTLPGNGRVVNVPIIDGLPNGSGQVDILGIASMYIAAWDRTGSPSRTQVYGIFLEQASFTPDSLAGVSDNPFAPLRLTLIR